MRRCILIIFELVCATVALSQNVMNVEPVHSVVTTTYDDGVGSTAIKDVTGVYDAVVDNISAYYYVTITSLEDVTNQTVLFTGVHTTNDVMLPITVSTTLFDLDTSNWELFAVVYPNGQRELAQVVVISENGTRLVESPVGCESAVKFFGDDGTFQFQNQGTTFVNTSDGSVLRMGCDNLGTDFVIYRLPGQYYSPNCCCTPTLPESPVVTNIEEDDPFLAPEDSWIWATPSRVSWDLELGSVTIFDMKGAEVAGFCPLNAGPGSSVHHWVPGTYLALYTSQDLTVKKTQKLVIP